MKTIQVKRLVSQRFIFAIRRRDDVRKVFQAMFLRDGSVVVNFPYYRDSTGHLSQPSLPAGVPFFEKFTIGDNDGSKCTSHRVKYTHHLDGEAHFSQDGKIYTSVRRKAVPLREANGHLFTLRVQGLDHFELQREKRPRGTRKRYMVTFDAPPGLSDSIQFTGWVYSALQLAKSIPNPTPVVGPLLSVFHPQQGVIPGVAICNPRDLSDLTILVITVHPTGRLFTNADSGLMFTGGFDSAATVHDYTHPTGFLALRCPIEDIELAKSEIGTVDRP